MSMTFRLIDDCKIEFPSTGKTIERGIVRRNGDTITISAFEPQMQTMTLTTGEEVSEPTGFFTGRSIQVDRLTEIKEEVSNHGVWTYTGTSDQARERHLSEDEAVVTIRVTPGPNCQSCG